MKIERIEKFGIEKIEASIEIDGKEIKDGDGIIIKDENGEIAERGTIRFCIYDDTESPFYHLGFLVKWSSGSSITLPEVFLWLKEDKLEWEVVRSGKGGT